MNRTQVHSATLASALIIILFLWSSTLVPFFQNWPAQYMRHFQDAYAFKIRGADLRLSKLATERFLNRENVYKSSPETFHQFVYPPQGLLLTLPFTVGPSEGGYFRFIVSITLMMYFCYLAINRSLLRTSHFESSLQFLILFFFSYPGLYAYERGNIALLGSAIIFMAFAAILKKHFSSFAILIALAVSIKPLFLPYVVLFFFLPQKRRSFLLFISTTVLLCFATVMFYGSWQIYQDYISASHYFEKFYQPLFGATNIGLISSASLIFHELGFSFISPFIMNYEASFIVLGILLWVGWHFGSWKKGCDLITLFGWLTYISVLWQFMSVSYGVLHILVLLPIAERMMRDRASKWQLHLLHAIFIALIFAPPEFRPPLLRSFRGLYYIAAFLIYIIMARRYTFQLKSGAIPSRKEQRFSQSPEGLPLSPAQPLVQSP